MGMTSAQWGYITGDVSTFAYKPTYNPNDVVYYKPEFAQAASSKFNTIYQRPYKVLRVGINQNSSGAPLKNSDGTAITGAVGAQADAPWVYDIQEILKDQTVATASGPVKQGVKESDLAALAGIKTYVGTEVGDWADPAAS